MIADFVLETTNAPGTSTTVNLAGAASGRRTFASAFASGALAYYYMDDGTQAEWGYGTFTSGSPNTITRGVVIGNTAGTTARLNFAGTTRIYNEVPAPRLPYLDQNSILNLGTISVSTRPDSDNTGYVANTFWVNRQVLAGTAQTWTNVTASRALSTTYTNSSGRPIFVAAACSLSSGNLQVTFYMNSIGLQSYSNGAPYAQIGSAAFIVPNGSTYSVVSNGSINFWGELR